MKELFEKYKKYWIGGIIGVIVCAACIVGLVYITSDKHVSAKETESQAVHKQTASKESAPTEKPVETVTDEALEAVSEESADVVTEESVETALAQEQPVTKEAAADAKDTKKTATEQPQQAQNTEQQPAAQSAAAPDISNMASNAEYPFEIHVNKQMNCITIYAMDTSGAYSIPYRAMICSTGNATPIGTFKTPVKYRWKQLMGGVWGQYATRIVSGVLFHSVQYRSANNSTLYSSAYNKLGTTASHGCVRLTTSDAKWIYDNCPIGTTVVIYNDSNPGPLGKPTAIKVPANNGWDPTDPDPANPWGGKSLRIEGVHDMQVERCTSTDLMAGIAAYDLFDANVTGNIQVTSNTDWNTAGGYNVHYTVSDSYGNVTSADATLYVVDTQAPVIAGVPARIEGKSAAEINRGTLLAGVSATDNGQGLSLDNVEVQIPALHDGENQITYIARDASGNQSTATTIVYTDVTAPVLTKTGQAESVLELNQGLDQSTILSRVSVQDMTASTVEYRVTNQEWGYQIDYTARDSYGNVSNLTDTVTYLDYEFVGSSSLTVSDINDTESLKAGLQLRDSKGRTSALGAGVQVTVNRTSDKTAVVHYSYTYQSPLGSHTAQFERNVIQ